MIRRRYLVLGLAATVAVAACSRADHQEGDLVSTSTSRTDFRAAVLDVRADGCEPREILGTASLIGSGHALTAAHVVAGARRTTVIGSDGERREAQVVLLDPDLDIAVLKTPEGIGEALDFYDGDIDAGTVGVVAFARLEDGRVDVRTTDLEVLRHVDIATTDIYLDRDVTRSGFEIAASIDPGDSGAVVVIGGGAAGVIWARSTEREGRAWAVDIPDVVRDPVTRRALVVPVDTGVCAR